MNGVLRRRASAMAVTVVVFGILLSACGGGGGNGSSAGSPPSKAATGATVVGTQMVPGIGTVLVDGKGLTLYYLTTDTSTKTTCSGECAQEWPPLLAGNEVPKAIPGVTGKFGTLQRPDGGTQITFDGKPLYTFEGDSGPGQATGQGVDSFFAVTT